MFDISILLELENHEIRHGKTAYVQFVGRVCVRMFGQEKTRVDAGLV